MEPNGLPTVHRFVTDHNSEGKAIFHESVDEVLQWQDLCNMACFSLGYVTAQLPINF